MNIPICSTNILNQVDIITTFANKNMNRKMKKAMILMLSLMLLSGSAMAQMTEQREPSMRPKRVWMTQDEEDDDRLPRSLVHLVPPFSISRLRLNARFSSLFII